MSLDERVRQTSAKKAYRIVYGYVRERYALSCAPKYVFETLRQLEFAPLNIESHVPLFLRVAVMRLTISLRSREAFSSEMIASAMFGRATSDGLGRCFRRAMLDKVIGVGWEDMRLPHEMRRRVRRYLSVGGQESLAKVRATVEDERNKPKR